MKWVRRTALVVGAVGMGVVIQRGWVIRSVGYQRPAAECKWALNGRPPFGGLNCCIDKRDGSLEWQQGLLGSPFEEKCDGDLTSEQEKQQYAWYLQQYFPRYNGSKEKNNGND